MLILERKLGETLLIGDNVRIKIVDIKGQGRCKLEVKAPRSVKVLRQEVAERDAIEDRHE